MMRRTMLTLAASAVALATPALAQNNPSGQAENGSDRVCRRPAAELGSRIQPRSVCKTRAEWDAESREAQQNMRSRHNPGSGDAFRNPPNRAVTGGN